MTLSNADPVPVTIVTGFLGSGKTTLLNGLLRSPALADTVVIVNEFGEAGLDHLLIEQAIENTVLLKNGCICCTVRGDVTDTLDTLWRQRAEGVIPWFRRVAIETTGLAEPGPVAHALVPEPGATPTFTLDGIVTTVDAVHGLLTLARHVQARHQVALADRIVLTKTDIQPNTAALEAAISRCNPSAGWRAIRGGVEADDVFGLEPSAALGGWVAHHGHHDHEHLGGIWSCLVTADRPIPWPALQVWLDSTLSLRGDAILRLKGLVDVAGETLPVVLQGVHHVMHPASRLAAWPGGRRRTEIVAITDGLDGAGLQTSFERAMHG